MLSAVFNFGNRPVDDRFVADRLRLACHRNPTDGECHGRFAARQYNHRIFLAGLSCSAGSRWLGAEVPLGYTV